MKDFYAPHSRDQADAETQQVQIAAMSDSVYRQQAEPRQLPDPPANVDWVAQLAGRLDFLSVLEMLTLHTVFCRTSGIEQPKYSQVIERFAGNRILFSVTFSLEEEHFANPYVQLSSKITTRLRFVECSEPQSLKRAKTSRDWSLSSILAKHRRPCHHPVQAVVALEVVERGTGVGGGEIEYWSSAQVDCPSNHCVCPPFADTCLQMYIYSSSISYLRDCSYIHHKWIAYVKGLCKGKKQSKRVQNLKM